MASKLKESVNLHKYKQQIFNPILKLYLLKWSMHLWHLHLKGGHFELEGAAPPSLRSDPASIKGGKSSTSSSSSLSSPSSLSSMSHHCHHHHQHQHPPHSEVWPRLHYQREGLGFSKNATHPHKWSCNTDKYMLWCIGKCQEVVSCSHSVVWFGVVWGRGVMQPTHSQV